MSIILFSSKEIFRLSVHSFYYKKNSFVNYKQSLANHPPKAYITIVIVYLSRFKLYYAIISKTQSHA